MRFSVSTMLLLLSLSIEAQIIETPKTQFIDKNDMLAITSAGGNMSNESGSISYSIGQAIYTIDEEAQVSITLGIQRTGNQDLQITENTMFLSIFPNPTTQNTTLHVLNADFKDMAFKLFDMQGRFLQIKEVVKENTQILTDHLPAGLYFVNLIRENTTIKSFKLLKK